MRIPGHQPASGRGRAGAAAATRTPAPAARPAAPGSAVATAPAPSAAFAVSGAARVMASVPAGHLTPSAAELLQRTADSGGLADVMRQHGSAAGEVPGRRQDRNRVPAQGRAPEREAQRRPHRTGVPLAERLRDKNPPSGAQARISELADRYDGLGERRVKARLTVLGELRDAASALSGPDPLKALREIVEQETQAVSDRFIDLADLTSRSDGPYEMMTREGLLWRDPEFEHRTAALQKSGRAYFEELSRMNLQSMERENASRREKGRFSLFQKTAEPSWMADTRAKLTTALGNSVLHHYTTVDRAAAMVDDRAMRSRTSLELEGRGNRHLTEPRDETALANDAFVFFFIEAPSSPLWDIRFAGGGEPARISLKIKESGLLQRGWVMLGDFARRDYPALLTESMQEYHAPTGGVAHRYPDRVHQNVLVGADIVPGLAERAVLEIARLEQAGQPLAARLKKMSGDELMTFLLTDLLHPQAMLPNSVPVSRKHVEPAPGPRPGRVRVPVPRPDS
ncbi:MULTISPECIES: hypothetical protein [Streptomyces]|uniref:hypothetical protein n=1 Tax=Streptomyces TaxID=1883 RepID=UPI00069B9E27|nr:hypothetical protein [Streptomyces sp. SID7805]MYU50615.1 hypothetical protein [Streptomyces sp. SID7805]